MQEGRARGPRAFKVPSAGIPANAHPSPAPSLAMMLAWSFGILQQVKGLNRIENMI